jgi:hypothetical protein
VRLGAAGVPIRALGGIAEREANVVVPSGDAEKSRRQTGRCIESGSHRAYRAVAVKEPMTLLGKPAREKTRSETLDDV